jgi:glycosyltransferase involved in cell wall biosynthesis
MENILIMKPLVSVLITVYNREQYITSAIESVLSSSYTNFELIIVDDCSADGSLGIARSYEKRDSRVKVFKNEKNLGDYPNRNKAAGYAKGKYIKYVDADDMIYPWGLEILVNAMESFDNVGWGLCTLAPDNDRIFPFKLSKEELFNYHFKVNSLFSRAPISSIINKDVFDSIGGFSGKRHLGDFELWLRLSLVSDLVLMPEGMIWNRMHDQQESFANRMNRFIPLKYDISLYKFLRKQKFVIDPDVKKSVLSKTKMLIVLQGFKFILHFKFRLVFKIVEELNADVETFS